MVSRAHRNAGYQVISYSSQVYFPAPESSDNVLEAEAEAGSEALKLGL